MSAWRGGGRLSGQLLRRDFSESGRALVAYADPSWIQQPEEGGRVALCQEYDVSGGWEESNGWAEFRRWFDGGAAPSRNGTRQPLRGEGGPPIVVTNNSRAGDAAHYDSTAATLTVVGRRRARE